MHPLLTDLRRAVRVLRRSPGFTAAAVLTLALGIAANTAVFSVLRSVLLRPLPYADPGRVVVAVERDSSGNNRLASYPTFQDWRAGTDVFEGLAFVRGNGSLLKGAAGAERVLTAYVSDDFFRVLREPALLGRALIADDMRPGAPPVAVLSERLWRRRFGADPAIVGRPIQLDDGSFTVVGVMGQDFGYPVWAELWAPLGAGPAAAAAVLSQRGVHADSRVIGRIRAGVDSAAARRALSLVAARLAATWPAENGAWRAVDLTPVSAEVIGSVGPQLRLLTGAVALVLLIACVNVANLSLARAATRARELAVRTALGARRRELARLLLAESLVLVGAGAVAGIIGALWGVEWIKGAAAKLLPRASEISVGWDVALGTIVVTALAVIAAGVLPALRGASPELGGTLKEGSTGSGTGRAEVRLRSTLVIAEVALALMLVTGSGLLIRSLARLQDVDPGFRLDHLIAAPIFPPAAYHTPEADIALYRRVADAAARIPGVTSVALTNHVPLSGASMSTRLEVEGVAPAADGSDQALFRIADTAYFATVGDPILRGRNFTREDIDHPGDAVIVNQTLARRYWPNADPIGRRLTIFKSAQGRPEFGEAVHATVVGLVGDVHHFTLDAPAVPEVYVPYTLTVWGWMSVVVRASGDSDRVMADLTRAIHAVEPDIPLTGADPFAGVHEVSAQVRASLAPRRLVAALLTGFAVPALLLAALGIYGVIAYLVSRRTQEIGIRVALGASRADVIRLVLRRGLRLVLGGIVLGAAGSLAGTRLLTAQLYGVRAADPATFIVAALVLALVGLAASYLPARRAAALDPMRSLRAE